MPQLSTFCPISNNGSADWIPNDYFRCLWMDQMLIGNFTQIWQRNATQKNFRNFWISVAVGFISSMVVFRRAWMSLAGSWAHLMRSLWQLFHDTPARREDFVKLTGSTVFPLKFCPHRWVEDVVVAEWAHQMWPNIKKYVSSFHAPPKKAPQTASLCHNQRSMWGPTDGDQAVVLHLHGETTSAIFAQVPDRCPNGSFHGAVIERPLANLDGPLHQERCSGAGWLVSETDCNRPLWQEKTGAL